MANNRKGQCGIDFPSVNLPEGKAGGGGVQTNNINNS